MIDIFSRLDEILSTADIPVLESAKESQFCGSTVASVEITLDLSNSYRHSSCHAVPATPNFV